MNGRWPGRRGPARAGLGGLRAASALALLGAGLASGCIASYQTVPWVNTQRYPGPMEQRANLPAGSQDDYPEGPEVVLIVRHADPVQVRRAGLPQGTPMAFYDKRARVHSGSWVHSGAGGRAEVLWPHGTSVLLIGYSTGIVGSTSRGDPTFVFREMDSARIEPSREERIQLLGGAVLVAAQGPIVLERVREDILELRNQSEDLLRVEYRDETLTVEPGEVVDLALLGAGSRPRPQARRYDRIGADGFDVGVAGDVDAEVDGAVVALAARGPAEVRALGVGLRLNADDRVTFHGFGGEAALRSAPDEPPAAPEEAHAESQEETSADPEDPR